MTSYRGLVKLNSKSKTLDANIEVELLNQDGQDEIVFYLPTETTIKNIKSIYPLKHTIQNNPDWNPLILGTKELKICLEEERILNSITLNLEYVSHVENLPEGGMTQFDENAVELGVYLPWFPLQPSFPKANFDVVVESSDFSFIGNPLNEAGDKWRIKSPEPVVGFPIIGTGDLAKNMSIVNLFESEIKVYSTKDTDSNVVNEVLDDVSSIISLYSNIFGKTQIESLDIYLSPRDNTDVGGGYCRPGLIVLPCGKNTSTSVKYVVEKSLYMFKYLAHELGHLWWCLADIDSRENWINESFAEYASLIAIRELKSAKTYKKILQEYKQETRDLDSIISCSLNHEDHFSIWYMKGPYMLSELELYMGNAQFTELLQAMVKNQVKCTDEIVTLLCSKHQTFFNKLIRE